MIIPIHWGMGFWLQLNQAGVLNLGLDDHGEEVCSKDGPGHRGSCQQSSQLGPSPSHQMERAEVLDL